MSTTPLTRRRAHVIALVILIMAFAGGVVFLAVSGSLSPHAAVGTGSPAGPAAEPSVWNRSLDAPTLALLRLGLVALLAFGLAGLTYRAAIGHLAFRMGPFALEDYAEKSADESAELSDKMDRRDREVDGRLTRLESLVDDLAEAAAGDIEALEDRIRVIDVHLSRMEGED